LGLSRSKAAQIAAEGGVHIDGALAQKSSRVTGGARVDVIMPEPEKPLSIVADPVPGMKILYEDPAIIVVTYHALVQGLPDPVVGTIEASIGRHPRRDGLYAVR
ncbi:RNA pseudouridine synthase, partial [Brevibacterium paucivorans]